LNIDIEEGRRAFNLSKIETLTELNNYVYSNSLYFSDDLFKSVEELQEIIKMQIWKKKEF